MALDLDAREATLDDGTAIAFERCLIATGARPRELNVEGGERTLLLRTLSDARRPSLAGHRGRSRSAR